MAAWLRPATSATKSQQLIKIDFPGLFFYISYRRRSRRSLPRQKAAVSLASRPIGIRAKSSSIRTSHEETFDDELAGLLSAAPVPPNTPAKNQTPGTAGHSDRQDRQIGAVERKGHTNVNLSWLKNNPKLTPEIRSGHDQQD